MFASGNLFAPGELDPGHLVLELDDVERAWGEPNGPQGHAWQGVTWTTGDTTPHTAKLALASHAGGSTTARASGLRIVAIPLSGAADFQSARQDGEVVVGSADAIVVELDVQPRAPGRYVVLASAAGGERPGGSGIDWNTSGPSGPWPHITFGRAPLLPAVLARVVNLPIEESRFTIVGRGGGVGATLRDAQIAAFRADDFADVVSVLDDVLVRTTNATPAPVPEVVAPATTDGSAWLTIQALVGEVAGGDSSLATFGFQRNGDRVYDVTQHSIGSEVVNIAFIDLVPTSAELTVSADVALESGPAGSDARVIEASTILLRL